MAQLQSSIVSGSLNITGSLVVTGSSTFNSTLSGTTGQFIAITCSNLSSEKDIYLITEDNNPRVLVSSQLTDIDASIVSTGEYVSIFDTGSKPTSLDSIQFGNNAFQFAGYAEENNSTGRVGFMWTDNLSVWSNMQFPTQLVGDSSGSKYGNDIEVLEINNRLVLFVSAYASGSNTGTIFCHTSSDGFNWSSRVRVASGSAINRYAGAKIKAIKPSRLPTSTAIQLFYSSISASGTSSLHGVSTTNTGLNWSSPFFITGSVDTAGGFPAAANFDILPLFNDYSIGPPDTNIAAYLGSHYFIANNGADIGGTDRGALYWGSVDAGLTAATPGILIASGSTNSVAQNSLFLGRTYCQATSFNNKWYCFLGQITYDTGSNTVSNEGALFVVTGNLPNNYISDPNIYLTGDRKILLYTGKGIGDNLGTFTSGSTDLFNNSYQSPFDCFIKDDRLYWLVGGDIADKRTTPGGTVLLTDCGVAALGYTENGSDWSNDIVEIYGATNNEGLGGLVSHIPQTINSNLTFCITNFNRTSNTSKVNLTSFKQKAGSSKIIDNSIYTNKLIIGNKKYSAFDLDVENDCTIDGLYIGTRNGKYDGTRTSFPLNSAVGYLSLDRMYDGSGNTALGNFALRNIMRSLNNTAVGDGAMWYAGQGLNIGDTIQVQNTAIGAGALGNAENPQNCTVVGAFAGQKSGANKSVLVGSNAGEFMQGEGNVGIGDRALQFSISQNSIGIGQLALNGNNNIFGENIAIGGRALSGELHPTTFLSASSTANIAIGLQSLRYAAAGGGNISIGNSSLILNSSGSSNVAIGPASLDSSVNNSQNIAIGVNALTALNNTTVENTRNIAIGINASPNINTGIENITLGFQAGNGLFSGNKNIFIGNNTDTTLGTVTNCIVIGDNASSNASNQATIGDANLTSFRLNDGTSGTGNLGFGLRADSLTSRSNLHIGHAGVGVSGSNFVTFYANSNIIGRIAVAAGGASVGYLTTSDYRLKEDIEPISGSLEKISNLKPCTFKFKNGPDDVKNYGFLAHELQEVIPQAVLGQKDAINENGEILPQGVDLSSLVPILADACKKMIEKNSQLENRISQLETIISTLQNK